jgi:hypothetical protein
MGKAIGGLALALLIGSGSNAQAGSWCVFYDFSTYNCGFHSYAQCHATAFGAGGWCRPNFFESNSQPSGKRSRAKRS